MKKKIIGIMLALSMMAVMLAGCGDTKESESPQETEQSETDDTETKDETVQKDEKQESNADLTEEEQKEIVDIVTKIVQGDMMANGVSLGAEELPSFTEYSQNFVGRYGTLSFRSESNVNLNVTYDYDGKCIKMLAIEKSDGTDDEYVITISEAVSLKNFGFSNEDITEIANLLTDQVYETNKNGYNIKWINDPVDVFSITR